MASLKRVFAWWMVYAALMYSMLIIFSVMPRLGLGLSIGAAVTGAAISVFGITMLYVLPVFAVLFFWALVLERRPGWESDDIALVISSVVMAAVVGVLFAVISVQPDYAWRTGSYAGDVGQIAVYQAGLTCLGLLLTRLVVRRWAGPLQRLRPLESAG